MPVEIIMRFGLEILILSSNWRVKQDNPQK